jgi:hypothetical protein
MIFCGTASQDAPDLFHRKRGITISLADVCRPLAKLSDFVLDRVQLPPN